MNREILIELINKGLNSSKISKELGKSQTTIMYWLNKYDLKTNPIITKPKSKIIIPNEILENIKIDYFKNELSINTLSKKYNFSSTIIWKYIGKENTRNYSESAKIFKKTLVFKHTEEFKKKQSILAKERNFGGNTSKINIKYINNNGDEVNLQSSYEIIVAKYLDEHNIKWIRPKPFKWIDSHNIEHNYYPDFYLIEYNLYLDPKNDYLIIKDQDKIERVIEQNKINLIVLNRNDLKRLDEILK